MNDENAEQRKRRKITRKPCSVRTMIHKARNMRRLVSAMLARIRRASADITSKYVVGQFYPVVDAW